MAKAALPHHVGQYAIERCVPQMLRRAQAVPPAPAELVWVISIEWSNGGWAWSAYLAPWLALEAIVAVPVAELRAQADRFPRALLAAVTVGDASYSEVVEWQSERAAPAAPEGRGS